MSEEYDFSTIDEAMDALDVLFVDGRSPSDDERRAISAAIEKFYKTRTNSQLVDIPNLPDTERVDGIGFFDYTWLSDPWYKEVDVRDWPMTHGIREILRKLGIGEWSTYMPDDSTIAGQVETLVKQVSGIQKKVDRIVAILEKFEVTMTAKQALEL